MATCGSRAPLIFVGMAFILLLVFPAVLGIDDPELIEEEEKGLDKHHYCGVDGSVGLPIASPTGTLFRRDSFCLCPLRTRCTGPGCILAAEHVYQAKIEADSKSRESLEGFDARKCPTCSCVPSTDTSERSKYLLISNGAEGMGSWRFSVAEVLFLARLTDRILILPCVEHGRLRPCWKPGVTLSLNSYIDFENLRRYHGKMLSYSDFVRDPVRNAMFHSTRKVICGNHHCRDKNYKGFSEGSHSSLLGLLANNTVTKVVVWNVNIFRVLDRIEELGDIAVILEAFRGMFRVPSSKNIPNLTPERFGVSAFWDYSNQSYQDANLLLKGMLLAEDYIAVHWRSETSKCNFTQCSQLLADGVQAELDKRQWDMSVTAPKRCLLVSDIPFNTSEVLWSPFAKDMSKHDSEGSMTRGMKVALKTLGVTEQSEWNGCAKIDSILHPSSIDSGLISIYDKILAAKAKQFYTCRVKKGSPCSPCARWNSNFDKEISQKRRHLGTGPSTITWPASSSQTEGTKIKEALYIKRAIGHCDVYGLHFVTSVAECSAAAASVGIRFNTTIAIDNETLPFGCFVDEIKKNISGQVYLNLNGVRNSLDTDRVSICSSSAESDTCISIAKQKAVYVPNSMRSSTTDNKEETLLLRHGTGPVLWSFPGAGNTWVRILLEKSSGYLTGSLYNDLFLKKNVLFGEGKKGTQVVAVKAHPTTFTFSKLKRYVGSNFAAIMLVREPYSMLWSEGQRRILLKHQKKSAIGPLGTHTSKMTRSFLRSHWNIWVDLALQLADDFVRMWRVEYSEHIAAGADSIFLDFDRLINKDTRQNELANTLAFLGSGWSKLRILCAFAAAETDSVRRPKSNGTDDFATLKDAYPNDLVCKLWKVISTAEPVARNLGFNWHYSPLEGNLC